MNTTSIKIEEGRVTIRPVAGSVWLTQHEIADLFGIFISAIGSNIRSIHKKRYYRKIWFAVIEITATIAY